MPQKVHTMHGRDHCHNGADPIPCLPPSPAGGDYQSVILAEPSLLGYWPLNEATGSDAFDLSPYGNDFANPTDFFGPPDQGSGGPFPDLPTETSYTFDPTSLSGDGDRLLGNVPASATGAATFELWLYPTATPAIAAHVAQIGTGGGSELQFTIRPGHNLFWSVEGAYDLDSVTTINFDDWTHVVGVCSTTETQRLYFNGAEIAEGSVHTVNWSAISIYLGSALVVSDYRPYGGRIAQVALYNAVLTPGQISNHYNAGVTAVADAPAGQVLTSDGTGAMAWAYPTIAVNF